MDNPVYGEEGKQQGKGEKEKSEHNKVQERKEKSATYMFDGKKKAL